MVRCWRYLSVLSLVLIIGCGGGRRDKSDGYDEDVPPGPIDTMTLPPFAPPESNVILGRVVDPHGQGLEGVRVSIDGSTLEGHTNYDGFYYIADVPAAEWNVLRFSHVGHVALTRPVKTHQDGRTTMNMVLRREAVAVEIAGEQVHFPMGALHIDPAEIATADGSAPVGKIRARMTPLPVRGDGIHSTPGDFSAVLTDGSIAQLETFAMADYELLDEAGERLQIRDGATATIELLLPEDTTLTAGEVLPAWYYDNDSGRWIEEGTGTVQPYSQDPERLAFVAEVAHFSVWNCDREMETTCVRGVVRLCDGTPVHADVMAQGLDYDGSALDSANAAGEFCVLVKTDATVSITAGYGFGAERLIGSTTVQTGSSPSNCDGTCTVAEITLPCTPEESTVDCHQTYFAGCKSCVRGRVLDTDGRPAAALLHVVSGATSYTVTTDAQGNYCAPAGLGALTKISATGAQGETGEVVFSTSQAGRCPSCEAAPDLTLDGAGNSVDFGVCVQDLGGVTVDAVLSNGAAPIVRTLDTGWVMATQRTEEQGVYHGFALDLVSGERTSVVGAPVASLHLDLETAPTAGQRVPLPAGSAILYTAIGGILGLGSESYHLDPNDPGFVLFDDSAANLGNSVRGSFEMRFRGDCAAAGATVVIRGRFETSLRDGQSSFLDSAFLCALFRLYIWALELSSASGAVQVTVDGSLLPGDSPLNGAKYSREEDRLSVSFFGETGYFTLTVQAPRQGPNPVGQATLTLDGNDCMYELEGGEVMLDQLDASTSWLAGSFTVNLRKSMWSEGECPPRTVTGLFAGPSCR